MNPSPDLSRTGEGGHAVVVRAGMAGLLAARALANHFERVSVIERDRLPEGPDARKGVPQGRMLHVMLPAGSGSSRGSSPAMSLTWKPPVRCP